MNLAASTSALQQPVLEESSFQAFERQGLFSRAAPFLGAMALAILVYPLPPVGHDSSALVTAAALNVLILASALLAPWRLLPHFAQVVPPFAYFVVIALLREADGGARSAYSVLTMLPVFWLALYGTRRELGLSIVGVAALFLTPLLLWGLPSIRPANGRAACSGSAWPRSSASRCSRSCVSCASGRPKT